MDTSDGAGPRMRAPNADDSSPPMRADARRNRARVLEAARVAFGNEGSNVSLDEIARRAGVGAGTVYRHFATKEALFEAVVVDRLGALTADARALSDDADPGPAFFAFVERLAREGARKRDVIEAFAHAGIDLQLGVAPALRELANALDQTLRRAQDAGSVRTDIGVDDVVAVVSGAAFAISQSSDDEDRIRTVLAITCDGLRSRR
jgi:AcrR family transcriptional regulator